ncbi:MAG: ABC transporter ATP-binding protein [Acidobacteriota bacterium]
MIEPVVVARGLGKVYRSLFSRQEVAAVEGLDFDLQAGEAVALVGPNGAGKTTTLRMLLGLLRPNSGRVTLFGQTPQNPSSRKRVGYLPEESKLYSFMTARQSLRFFGAMSGISRADLEGAVDRELDRVGLSTAADRKLGKFSKGMRQRLGLAQALIHRPQLLVLDEPTSGLDPQGRELFVRTANAERDRGTAILLSTHILPDVERISDRLLILARGRVRLDEKIETLSDAALGWRVEVSGHDPEITARLEAAGFSVREEGPISAIACHSSRKQELLGRLLDLGVEVREVRAQSADLESVYLSVVDGAVHG